MHVRISRYVKHNPDKAGRIWFVARVVLFSAALWWLLMWLGGDPGDTPGNLTYDPNSFRGLAVTEVPPAVNDIPLILHQSIPPPPMDPFRGSLMDECREMFSDWDIKIWTDESILEFVQKEFPQYYDLFTEMTPFIRQIDAVRYLWMYKFGGMYLDLDVECLRSPTRFVRGLPSNTAWLGGYIEPFFMLSSPKNHFWMFCFKDIIANWRIHNVRGAGGPQGLQRMAEKFVHLHGIDVVQLFSQSSHEEAVIIQPPRDVVAGEETWRWVTPRDTFEYKNSVHKSKLGFIPNQIIDPTGCRDDIRDCRYDHCHNRDDLGGALTVHHCLESWGGESAKKALRMDKGFST